MVTDYEYKILKKIQDGEKIPCKPKAMRALANLIRTGMVRPRRWDGDDREAELFAHLIEQRAKQLAVSFRVMVFLALLCLGLLLVYLVEYGLQ